MSPVTTVLLLWVVRLLEPGPHTEQGMLAAWMNPQHSRPSLQELMDCPPCISREHSWRVPEPLEVLEAGRPVLLDAV